MGEVENVLQDDLLAALARVLLNMCDGEAAEKIDPQKGEGLRLDRDMIVKEMTDQIYCLYYQRQDQNYSLVAYAEVKPGSSQAALFYQDFGVKSL
jgi:hypothetical protein